MNGAMNGLSKDLPCSGVDSLIGPCHYGSGGVHRGTMQASVDTIADMVGFDPLDGPGRTRLGIAYLVWRLRHSRVLELPAPSVNSVSA
jgi:hypothetical protein